VLPFESIQCPYCGESIELFIDDSVEHQQYVEDCQVCCRPINVSVTADADGGASVTVRAENEA
jgi:cysteine-rich CPXCG protein